MKVLYLCFTMIISRVCTLRTFVHSVSLSPLLSKAMSSSEVVRPTYNSQIECLDEDEMECFGTLLADYCDVSDVVMLRGDLGAGKTTICRGLIRGKLNDFSMQVTSPTYLLDNIYQYGKDQYIHHFDLYRMPTGCDVKVINIPNVFESALCLIEWPQRLLDNTPKSYLDINVKITPSQSRLITLTPYGDRWSTKIQTMMKAFSEDDSSE